MSEPEAIISQEIIKSLPDLHKNITKPEEFLEITAWDCLIILKDWLNSSLDKIKTEIKNCEDRDCIIEYLSFVIYDYKDLNISEKDFINICIENDAIFLLLISLDLFPNEANSILDYYLKQNEYETIKTIIENNEKENSKILEKYLEKKDQNYINSILEIFFKTEENTVTLKLFLINLDIFWDEKEILEFLLKNNSEKLEKLMHKYIILYNFSNPVIDFYIKHFERNLIKSFEKIHFYDKATLKSIEIKIAEIKKMKNSKSLLKKYFYELKDLIKIFNESIKESEKINSNLQNKLIWIIIKKINSVYLKNINNIDELVNKNETIIASTLFELFNNDWIDYNFLNRLWFSLYSTDVSEKYEGLKEKIVSDFMELYKQNYDNKNFFYEIEKSLNTSFQTKWTQIYMLHRRWEILFTSFLEPTEQWIYWWWFNTNLDFAHYWFWAEFLSEIIKEKWEDNDFICTVTSEIEWKENPRYKTLLRLYKKFWFEKFWELKNSSSRYIKLKRKKTNK